MKLHLTLVTTSLLALAQVAANAGSPWSALLKKIPQTEHFTSLFNGTDLTGWDGDKKYWSVNNGAIRGANHAGTAVPSSSYLFTNGSYREFRLLLEVRQTMSANHSTMHSAVGALGERFTDKGDNKHGFRGPLLMFCHDWGIWDAYRRNRTVPPNHRGTLNITAENKGGWNLVEILVVGNRIRFVANGQLVFDFTDKAEMLQTSPIGLQLHSNNRPQEYHFRGLVLTTTPTDQLLSLQP